MIVEYFIGFWLIIGSLFDYKFYKVPYFISFFVIVLSTPIIIINHVWTQPTSILGFKLFVILYFIAAWYVKKFGIADLKIIIPIVIMLHPLNIIVFISLMLIIGIAIGLYLLITKHQQKIPGFVPITIAYWIAILL